MSVRRLDATPDAHDLVQAAFGIAPEVLAPLDTAARFARLREAFLADTAFVSSLDEQVRHPAFRDIVAMGTAAVPLLLHDLSDPSAPWLAWSTALVRILGEAPPLTPEQAGRRDAVVAAWQARLPST